MCLISVLVDGIWDRRKIFRLAQALTFLECLAYSAIACLGSNSFQIPVTSFAIVAAFLIILKTLIALFEMENIQYGTNGGNKRINYDIMGKRGTSDVWEARAEEGAVSTHGMKCLCC